MSRDEWIALAVLVVLLLSVGGVAALAALTDAN